MEFPDLIKAGLKVGDEVDMFYGEGVVIAIDDSLPFPICIEAIGRTYSFTADGKYDKYDKYPSLWFKSDMSWFKPPTELPEPDHMKDFYVGRKVWVRDRNGKWKPRIAMAYLSSAKNKFCAFTNDDDQETAKDIICWPEVSYTRPEGAEENE